MGCRVLFALVVVGVGIAGVSPALAIRSVQGAVCNVSTDDASALGPVGFRTWSALPAGQTVFNQNTASCVNARCVRTYVTNSNLDPGGYISNQESTVYNGGQQNQPFYMLADAEVNGGGSNHIAYFGVAGVTANEAGVGSFLAPGCGGTTATNCLPCLGSSLEGPVLHYTSAGYGGPAHTIRAIGGLNPIPNVLVVPWCRQGKVCLSWNDPPTYEGAMRGSTTDPPPPSPVKGVRLYRNTRPGGAAPTSTDPGWTPIGDYDLGDSSAIDELPPDEDGVRSYYALTVRFVGPGGGTNELETFHLGVNSQPVGYVGIVVRIVRFDADYAGRGIVRVRWHSGVEGGLAGYYLRRGTRPEGPFMRVTGLIPAQGDESDYAVDDRVGSAGESVVLYRLEIVGRDGTVETSSTASVDLPRRSKRRGPDLR